MKRATHILVLGLAFGTPAHAMNSKMYKCGDVDVKLAIVKDNGKPVGRNVYFKVRLWDPYPTMKGGLIRAAPSITFWEIDDVRDFTIAGAKYNCTLVGEGYSDAEDKNDKAN